MFRAEIEQEFRQFSPSTVGGLVSPNQFNLSLRLSDLVKQAADAGEFFGDAGHLLTLRISVVRSHDLTVLGSLGLVTSTICSAFLAPIENETIRYSLEAQVLEDGKKLLTNNPVRLDFQLDYTGWNPLFLFHGNSTDTAVAMDELARFAFAGLCDQLNTLYPQLLPRLQARLPQDSGGEVEETLKSVSNSSAVLIGISNYVEGVAPLSNPGREVRTIAEALSAYEFERIEVYTNDGELLPKTLQQGPVKPRVGDRQLSARHVYDILDDLSKRYSERNGDKEQLFLWIACHGRLDRGREGLAAEVGAIMVADSKPWKEDPLLQTCIPYPILVDMVDNIPCKHILLVVDACHCGRLWNYRYSDESSQRKNSIMMANALTSRLAVTAVRGSAKTPDDSELTKAVLSFLEDPRDRRRVRNFSDLKSSLRSQELLSSSERSPKLGQFRSDSGGTFFFLRKPTD